MGKKSILLVWQTLICILLVGLVFGKPQPQTEIQGEKRHFQLQQRIPGPGIDSDSQQQGNAAGIELRHSHSFNAGTSDKTPLSGWFLLQGSVKKPEARYAVNGPSLLSNSLSSGRGIDIATTGLYTTALAVIFGTAYYIYYASLPTLALSNELSKKKIKLVTKSTTDKPKEKEATPKVEIKKADGNSADKKVNQDKKEGRLSRRRRDVNQEPMADADLTRLASIVLNAIASGECLQKTICQLGTQIGSTQNGRFAFTIIDTLLPKSVHSNQYFGTMKKALKGDAICEKFNCKYDLY